jgi:phosphopantothenoylcysteine decarboxylase / phosphopantothenate---cysteine ligase
MTQPIQNLVLGITGGIAAYKAAELVRLLVKQGISVQVVMTEAACQFITPTTMQALSGKPVFTHMWDERISNGMPHIDISRAADAILIAPASADFIAKLAHGMANDLLSTLCLARDCPLLVAPAMNKQMWKNPATQRNIQQLQQDGITLLGPDTGEQACGELGLGRMLEAESIVLGLQTWQQDKILAGKRILITAGPTQELIDPVRAITNLSSGKMGYQIAQMALNMGAQVTLVSGPVAIKAPAVQQLLSVRSAEDMRNAVMQHIHAQDIFISVAAVADYKPATVSPQKIKKSEHALYIELVPNPDILLEVANLPQAPFCVGFAAETEQLIPYAAQKRLRKNLPLIAANIANEAFGNDDNQLILIDDKGEHHLPLTTKQESARLLLQHIVHMLPPT